MKAQEYHMFADRVTASGPERILSFQHFLSHLGQLAERHPSRRKMLSFVIDHFNQSLRRHGPLTSENISRFASELYYLYTLCVPLLSNEENVLWALAQPLSGDIFYGTEAFYQYVSKGRLSEQMSEKLKPVHGDVGRMLAYQLIFERLYGFPELSGDRLTYTIQLDNKSLPRYYAIRFDNSFVTVTPKGNLTAIDYDVLKGKKFDEINKHHLTEMISLDNFRVEGFSIISMEDITQEYVLEELKNITARGGPHDLQDYQAGIQKNLQLLTDRCELRTWVTPILKLNGSPLLHEHLCSNSPLYNQILEKIGETQLIDYLQAPYPITFQTSGNVSELPAVFRRVAIDSNSGSFAALPLFHNAHAVGLLELHLEEGTMTANTLTQLRPAIPLLTQFVNDIILDFKARLDAVILDRYTALQPAVQWKFNEAALQYIKAKEPQTNAIRFEHVYPMYGAIDIRNSTVRRNEALLADLSWQLDVLHDTLMSIDRLHPVPTHLVRRAQELKKRLETSQVDYVQMAISQFIEEEVKVSFNILADVDNALTVLIHAYREHMYGPVTQLHRHRRAFDASITEVNPVINQHLDAFNQRIQAIFPSYFEKFRTDGIEFDSYVGQSIAPHIPYSSDMLRRIKQLQLETMAIIAKDTHALADSLPVALETTQLIFVNNGEIDISFREDERRFDVEGTYNVRYHVIKKRIDKALVKGSTARVTQPGKITLVYMHEETLYDHQAHIEDLQDRGLLMRELEYLELEELQGVSGLRALRVPVVL